MAPNNMISVYDNIQKRTNMIRNNKNIKDTISYNFVKGAMVEITGNAEKEYTVEFIDAVDNNVIHSGKITSNHWIRPNRVWYTNWYIKIYENEQLILEHTYNAKGKKVYIHLDSKSLGDTLAWFPYVEEFRKKHECIVICSTFWNSLFRNMYKNIKFVEPGSTVNELYAMYEIGWFSNTERHLNKRDPRLCSLQEIACDALGLDFIELIPDLYVTDTDRKIKDKYVCIATASTCQAKYWNNEGGWQKVIDYLNSIGYKVVLTQIEDSDLKNIYEKTGKADIQKTINYLLHCDFFIGISSGISWVAWALRKPVILISGFTLPLTEFKTNVYRIINTSVCNGCMNNSDYTFDKGAWNWCPVLEGTDGHFECSKQIYPESVINTIQEIISNDIKSIYSVKCRDGKIKDLNLYKLAKNFLWENTRNGVYESSAVGAYYEVFMEKDYNRGGVSIQKNDIVVDIGANVGVFTRYAKLNGASKIYCYEPEMDNFKCLKNNTSEECTLYNVAVSNKKGLKTLYIDSTEGGHSLVNSTVNNTKTGITQKIQAITLNDIMNEVPQIDFLKVDTEGSEWDIFENSDRDKLSKIRNIVVEYHNMIYGFDNQKREEFIKLFTDIGFKFYIYFVDSIGHLQLIYFWK